MHFEQKLSICFKFRLEPSSHGVDYQSRVECIDPQNLPVIAYGVSH